ncbi:MAG TPA: SDR family oxidoreductase [Mycobacteriales bacterium]|nr:SDR family oxidoreductase [Mycobacteriales bacterium]
MTRSVVVTGANSGIGLATTLLLAKSGFDVIGTVRSTAKADVLVGAAEAEQVVVRTVLCDVTDRAATVAAFAEISALTAGGPWAVVNNAGYAQAGAIEDVDDEHVLRQLETNLVAPARVARLVLPAMRARGEGRIVNISSVAGRVSLPVLGWYCASKRGLEAMTDALRMEVAPFGVRVSLVEPGSFGTGIWGEADYPKDPATPEYATAYARGAGGTNAASRFMPDPIWVARTVRLALTSPVPLARYLVGVDAVGGTIAERVLPTFISDRVKAITAGLARLPFQR